MVYLNPRGNPEPPLSGGTEADTLLGALERQRSVLAWKCGGLDTAGLNATVGVSTITLGGLLKHLALTEDHYFHKLVGGNAYPAVWESVDNDWEWTSAARDTPDVLNALWREAVGRSRAVLNSALSTGDLDQPVPGIELTQGGHPSLRRVLIDVVEEYARHVGHADLIRESVDGVVGEDAPERIDF